MFHLLRSFTLIAHSQQIRPIGMELASRAIDCVQQAGIANVMPIESHFNYARMCNEMRTARNWPDCAVRHIEAMFNDASEIHFETILVLNDNIAVSNAERPTHAFGHLEVVLHNGQRIGVADILITMGAAQRLSDVEFGGAIEASTSTRNMRRWLDNRNNRLERPNVWHPHVDGAVTAGGIVPDTNDIGAGTPQSCARKLAAGCESIGVEQQTDDVPLRTFVGRTATTAPRPPNQRTIVSEQQQQLVPSVPMPPIVPSDGAVTLRADHPMVLRIRQRQRALEMLQKQASTTTTTVDDTNAAAATAAAPSIPAMAPVAPKPASKCVPAGFALDQLHTVNQRPDDRHRHEMRARLLRAKQERRAHQAIFELDALEAKSLPMPLSPAATTSSAVETVVKSPPPPPVMVDAVMPILPRIAAVAPRPPSMQMTSLAVGSGSIAKRGGGGFGAFNNDKW